jgi:hypothetical protein
MCTETLTDRLDCGTSLRRGVNNSCRQGEAPACAASPERRIDPGYGKKTTSNPAEACVS